MNVTGRSTMLGTVKISYVRGAITRSRSKGSGRGK